MEGNIHDALKLLEKEYDEIDRTPSIESFCKFFHWTKMCFWNLTLTAAANASASSKEVLLPFTTKILAILQVKRAMQAETCLLLGQWVQESGARESKEVLLDLYFIYVLYQYCY